VKELAEDIPCCFLDLFEVQVRVQLAGRNKAFRPVMAMAQHRMAFGFG
jgi:hypothetical protein